MGKQADVFLKEEPWGLTQEGFDPLRNPVAESVFALANESMGIRGYAEEGTDAKHLKGFYINGVYEWGDEPEGGSYKGIVRRTHYMVCCPDPLYTDILFGSQPIRPDSSSDYVAHLDFLTGRFERSYQVTLADHTAIQVKLERILSMDHPNLLAQRITLCADKQCELVVRLGIDGNCKHQTTGKSLWTETASSYTGTCGRVTFGTKTTDQEVTYAYTILSNLPFDTMEGDRWHGKQTTVQLSPHTPWTCEKIVHITVNAFDGAKKNAAFPSFDQILEENQRHYAQFWQHADVEIYGDDAAQQGIRFCLFQLHQTYRGLDGRHNIGAKGLTGEAYNGHAFWDSETYCLPYYLWSDPQAAKGLLLYRYHTLPQAKKRAQMLDCQGACYPIATLNGDEACTLWQHASLQMQPSTAVAYGIESYVRFTGDTEFLYREGIEMLVEICRYVVSRGDWNQDHTGFGFYGVMGPDEFHMMGNNDFYTNYMGKRTLEYTLEVLASMPNADRWASQEERENWAEIAGHMIFHQREDGVFEQQDDFFSLPHLDIHAIPVTDFPLYDHWSYDRIYRTDMIKQPDVLMAFFLHPEDFSMDELRANYDYYEPRCIHESSLSPSVHAILAEALGREDDAFRFFGFATRMDLDNYNRNTGEGLHTTSIAASWITIVYGFGGLRLKDGKISLTPHCPAAWTGYRFRLRKGESVIAVDVKHDAVTVSLVEGPPVTILLNGVEQEVQSCEKSLPSFA